MSAPKHSGLSPPALARLLEKLARDHEEPGDLKSSLRRIVETAQELFEADLATVFAINPVTKEFLHPPSWCGQSLQGRRVEFQPPREEGLTRWVLNEKLVVSTNLAKDGIESSFSRQQGIRTVAAVALSIQRTGQRLAVVYLDFRERQEWTQGDLELLKLFAIQASLRLQSVWFLRRYRAVARAGHAIHEEMIDPAGLVHRLEGHLRDVLETERCFLLALGESAPGELRLWGSVDEVQVTGQPAVASGIFDRVLREGKGRLMRSRRAGAESDAVIGLADPGSMIVVPLLSRRETLGILVVQHHDEEVYNLEDLHLFELLGTQVALACSNHRLFGSLQRLNKAGQVLTERLRSADTGETILEKVVDRIREATRADLVILYSFVEGQQRFELPPTRSGDLLHPEEPDQVNETPGDIARRAVQSSDPIFARDSGILYRELSGDPANRSGDFVVREKLRSTAIVPLAVAQERIGVLFVNFRSPQPFDLSQRLLIEGLAGYAAISIRNSRTFGRFAGRPLNELRILQRLDRFLGSTLELDEILQRLLELALEAVPADEASALLFEAKKGQLVTRAAVGESRKASLEQAFFLGENRSIALEVFREGKSVLVGDVRHPDWRGRFVSFGGRTFSELDVPIIADDEVVGVLNFESRRKNAFDEDHLRFAEMLAGQAVLAVLRARDHEAAQRLADERKALIELANVLVRESDPDRIHRLVVERAIETTRAHAGVLTLADRWRRKLKVVAEQGVADGVIGRFLDLEKGVIGDAFRTGVVQRIPDVRQVPSYERAVQDTVSELAVPIKQDDDTLGVINIESSIPDFFGEHDEHLVLALADVALLAMQNAERLKNAEQRADRLQALHRVGRIVIAQLDEPDDAIRAIVEQALRLTEADFADLDLYVKGERARVYVAERLAGNRVQVEQLDLKENHSVELARGLMTHIAEAGPEASYLSEGDVREDERYAGSSERIRSELIVRLEKTDRLFGILNVESRELGAFQEEHRFLLQQFADLAVIALENAENYRQAASLQERFKNLYGAATRMAEVATLDRIGEAYETVVEISHRLLQCRAVVLRAGPEGQSLDLVASSEPTETPSQARTKATEGLDGHVATTRPFVSCVIWNAKNPPRGLPSPNPFDPSARSLAVAPIHFRDTYYGNLSLSSRHDDHFAGTDVELISGLALQLSLTIHRLEVSEAQQRTAMEIQEGRVVRQAAFQAYEVTHRLSNDIGWIPNALKRKLKRVFEARQRREDSSPLLAELEALIRTIKGDVDRVLKSGEKVAETIKTKERIERHRFSARQLLQDALIGFKMPDEIDVTFEAPEDDQLEVRVNYEGITSALYNLIRNAVEAMGTVGDLSLAVRRRGQWVEISVADSGPGVPAARRESIFRLGEGRPGGGSGLAGVKLNVEIEGGDVVVSDGDDGVGAVFMIRLPPAARGR